MFVLSVVQKNKLDCSQNKNNGNIKQNNLKGKLGDLIARQIILPGNKL